MRTGVPPSLMLLLLVMVTLLQPSCGLVLRSVLVLLTESSLMQLLVLGGDTGKSCSCW